jgi:hypothetical protein
MLIIYTGIYKCPEKVSLEIIHVDANGLKIIIQFVIYCHVCETQYKAMVTPIFDGIQE